MNLKLIIYLSLITPSRAFFNIIPFGRSVKIHDSTVPNPEDNKIRPEDIIPSPIPNYSNTKVSQDDMKADIASSIDPNEIYDTESVTPANDKRQQYSNYRFRNEKHKAIISTPPVNESAIKPIESTAVDYSALKPPPPSTPPTPPPEVAPTNYAKRQEQIRSLKSHYTMIGGEDPDVHTSKSIKFIRAAVEEQEKINKEKPKVKKEKRGKK